MNLLIQTITPLPSISFFKNEKFIALQEVGKHSGFADIISLHAKADEIENIFYISGPASFTGLRNLSVFLNTFKSFNTSGINFYALSSFQFLELLFPQRDQYILPTGRTECFVGNTQKYTQVKQRDLSEEQKEKIEVFQNIDEPKIKIFFPSLLETKDKYRTDTIQIEYGADPRIG